VLLITITNSSHSLCSTLNLRQHLPIKVQGICKLRNSYGLILRSLLKCMAAPGSVSLTSLKSEPRCKVVQRRRWLAAVALAAQPSASILRRHGTWSSSKAHARGDDELRAGEVRNHGAERVSREDCSRMKRRRRSPRPSPTIPQAWSTTLQRCAGPGPPPWRASAMALAASSSPRGRTRTCLTTMTESSARPI
jgi:hypothetical protein